MIKDKVLCSTNISDVVVIPKLFEVEVDRTKHIKGDDVALAVDVAIDLLSGKTNMAVILSGDGNLSISKEKLSSKRCVLCDDRGFARIWH